MTTPPSSEQPAGAPTCYRHPGRETWIRCQRCDRPICPDCMHPASVGFQCPECLQEGRRSVRQPRTAYGGALVANPQVTSIALIALNALVFVAVLSSGGGDGTLFRHLALLPQGAVFRLPDGSIAQVDGVADGAWWQLVTSMFTHAEVWHIGFNMLALWFLGPSLERVLGRVRFLAVYLISGLCGSTAVMLLAAPHSETIGASGAIFGVMGALLVVGFKVGADMQQLLFWLALNLVLTFTSGGISWQGHLGGLVGGAVCAAVIAYAPRQRRTPVQVGGLLFVVALCVVLLAVRIAALG